MTWWTNGLGYVTDSATPTYKFGVGKTTDFGQWYSPQGFSTDVTRPVTHCAARRLERAGGNYPLQMDWRAELEEHPITEEEQELLLPREVTGTKSSWRERTKAAGVDQPDVSSGLVFY